MNLQDELEAMEGRSALCGERSGRAARLELSLGVEQAVWEKALAQVPNRSFQVLDLYWRSLQSGDVK